MDIKPSLVKDLKKNKIWKYYFIYKKAVINWNTEINEIKNFKSVENRERNDEKILYR